jgi:hypothetical protein
LIGKLNKQGNYLERSKVVGVHNIHECFQAIDFG